MGQRVQHSSTLITAQSAQDTAGVVNRGMVANAREHTFYAKFTGAVSAGVVTIEAAPDPDYSGTWSSIGTMAFAAGAAKHLSVTGCHRALRARISTAIVGGTVTVDVVSN
jgi:hypothetical protein